MFLCHFLGGCWFKCPHWTIKAKVQSYTQKRWAKRLVSGYTIMLIQNQLRGWNNLKSGWGLPWSQPASKLVCMPMHLHIQMWISSGSFAAILRCPRGLGQIFRWNKWGPKERIGPFHNLNVPYFLISNHQGKWWVHAHTHTKKGTGKVVGTKLSEVLVTCDIWGRSKPSAMGGISAYIQLDSPQPEMIISLVVLHYINSFMKICTSSCGYQIERAIQQRVLSVLYHISL